MGNAQSVPICTAPCNVSAKAEGVLDEELQQADGSLGALPDGVKMCPVSGKLTTEGSCPMAKPRPKKKPSPETQAAQAAEAAAAEAAEAAEAAAAQSQQPEELQTVPKERADSQPAEADLSVAKSLPQELGTPVGKEPLANVDLKVGCQTSGSTAASSEGSEEQKEQKAQKEQSEQKDASKEQPAAADLKAAPKATGLPSSEPAKEDTPQAKAAPKAAAKATAKAVAKAEPKAAAEAAEVKVQKAPEKQVLEAGHGKAKKKAAPKKKELSWEEQLKRKRAEMDKMEKMGMQFHEMGGKLESSDEDTDEDAYGCPSSQSNKVFEAELKKLKKQMRDKMTEAEKEEADNPWNTTPLVPDEERLMKKNMFIAFYRDKYNKLKSAAAPDMKQYEGQNAKLGLSAQGGHMPMPRPKGVKPPPDFRKPVGRLSVAEMAKYNCENKRMLISIHGDIFDISDRPDKYGAEGPYWYMAGHDLTWGLLVGNDAEAELDKFYDIFKISPKEVCDQHLQGLMSWWAFYEKEYGKPVGRNTGYDKEWGLPPPPNKGEGIDGGKCSIM